MTEATLLFVLGMAIMTSIVILARRRTTVQFTASPPQALPWLFALVSTYPVVLITVWTIGNNDPLYTRYLYPWYPFLVCLPPTSTGGRVTPRHPWRSGCRGGCSTWAFSACSASGFLATYSARRDARSVNCAALSTTAAPSVVSRLPVGAWHASAHELIEQRYCERRVSVTGAPELRAMGATN
jgi:hypothetical protein